MRTMFWLRDLKERYEYLTVQLVRATVNKMKLAMMVSDDRQNNELKDSMSPVLLRFIR